MYFKHISSLVNCSLVLLYLQEFVRIKEDKAFCVYLAHYKPSRNAVTVTK